MKNSIKNYFVANVNENKHDSNTNEVTSIKQHK